MDPIAARERRWWNQLRCGKAEAGAKAGFALSALLCDRGRDDEAEMILADCARSESGAIAAAAALRLAQLIERRRGPAAAEPSYEQAAERATPTASADVLIDLAERWGAQGETERARRAYSASATGSPQPRLRAVAFFRLGGLDRDAGRVEEAIDAWEGGLADAEGPLRIHLLVRLAEALMDLDVIDRDRVESLLVEAMDSDHPDLAPRAALRLAQMKRAVGEFIDAYRLARLVVDSAHPVFAAEGEGEWRRLLHGELDSLLDLEAPDPHQLELPGRVQGTCSAVSHYFSIAPGAAPLQSVDGWFGNRRDSAMMRHALPLLGQAKLWSPCSDPCDGDPATGGAFWSALVTHFHGDSLSALRLADGTGQDRAADGSGWSCREADLLAGLKRSGDNARCSRHDLEFLLLLRATGWLCSESLSSEPHIPWPRLRLVFKRTAERLVDLLAVERRSHKDREALWLMGMLDAGRDRARDRFDAVPPLFFSGASSHGGVEMAASVEVPAIEKVVIDR
jgi:tetratricopeptide (TPR) repeat protein